MTVIVVRDFRREDAEAVATVRRAVLSFEVTTPQAVRFGAEHANPAKKQRMLVAERDGEIVGTATAGLVHDAAEPGQAYAALYVHPDHRRIGVGGLLLRTAEDHLATEGVRAVYVWALDIPATRAFAERSGYRPARPSQVMRLDLEGGTLPEVPGLPPGVELRAAADYAGDPHPLFAADAEAVLDEPNDVTTVLDDYDDWLADTWNSPLFDRDLSTVVTLDGEVAAFSFAYTDRSTRYLSGGTGTRRAHRGKGLAKLAKTDSLRRARAAGFTDAFTSNDADNGPMLAINEWFGYEPCAKEVRLVRTCD